MCLMEEEGVVMEEEVEAVEAVEVVEVDGRVAAADTLPSF